MSAEPRFQVLVIDDERDLVDLLRINLENAGYGVREAFDGRSGFALIRDDPPDLAIVDVMMPEMDGIELVRRIRGDPQIAQTPILLLTAKTTERDELEGLTVGADDYVSKPFSMSILLARAEALLRRSKEESPHDALRLGDILVDLRRHEASIAGEPLALTRTEFRILSALLAARGRVLSRSTLIGKAIGVGVAITRRTIDVHVASLRRKLGPHAEMIRTVRGVGYRADDGSPQGSVIDDDANA